MGNVDWKSLEGKYFKVDVGSTTAEALSGGDNSVIYYTTDGNVVLNGQVFGGGCLDLGLVSSDDAGCAEAAKSEVAGNRQITMIRFRVRGVTSEKVTVIWQWCNGVDVCAQLKFVDKSVWRRNVNGATGVAGATTSATQWERTFAHYLGYDAANRKIQLKDYNQTVFGDVQLPLATETQAGLIISEDYVSLMEWKNSWKSMLESVSDFCNNDALVSVGLEITNQKVAVLTYNQQMEEYVAGTIPAATSSLAGVMSAADKAKLDMRADVREKCYGFNVKGVKNGATYDASAVPWSQADMKAWSKSSNGIFPLFFIPGSGGGNMYRPVAVEVYAMSTKMVFVFNTGIVVQNWQYNAATSKWTVTVTTL